MDKSRKVYGMSQTRVWVLTVLLLLPVTAIGWRLASIQIIKASSYRAEAEAQQSRQYEIPAKRGEIYLADNGELYPIALNNSLKFLYADPSLVRDPNTAANKLSPIIGIDEAKLSKLLTSNNKNRYVETRCYHGSFPVSRSGVDT